MPETKTLARSNPAQYRDLCQPCASLDAADAAWEAFFAEVYELRCKHRIPDVHMVVRQWVRVGEEEGVVVAHGHYGDPLQGEVMLAQALGDETARRAEVTARVAGGKKRLT